jgi:hypothetical protein
LWQNLGRGRNPSWFWLEFMVRAIWVINVLGWCREWGLFNGPPYLFRLTSFLRCVPCSLFKIYRISIIKWVSSKNYLAAAAPNKKLIRSLFTSTRTLKKIFRLRIKLQRNTRLRITLTRINFYICWSSIKRLPRWHWRESWMDTRSLVSVCNPHQSSIDATW